MKRLMDYSIVQDVQRFRHKVELMARASESNESKSLVLLHNNPLPVLSGEALDEGIQQYFGEVKLK